MVSAGDGDAQIPKQVLADAESCCRWYENKERCGRPRALDSVRNRASLKKLGTTLIEGLASPKSPHRLECFNALEYAAEVFEDDILTAVHSPELATRCSAVTLLGVFGDKHTDVLGKIIAEGSESKVRMAAAKSLANCSTNRRTAWLVQGLRGDTSVQAVLLRLLAEDHAEVTRVLKSGQVAQPKVEFISRSVLGAKQNSHNSLSDGRLIPAGVRELLSGARRLPGEDYGEAEIESIVAYMKGARGRNISKCHQALACIRTAESVNALLDHHYDCLSGYAAICMQDYDERIVALLVESLLSRSTQKQDAAIKSLAIAGRAWAIPVIVYMLQQHPDHVIRGKLYVSLVQCFQRYGFEAESISYTDSSSYDFDGDIKSVLRWWRQNSRQFVIREEVVTPPLKSVTQVIDWDGLRFSGYRDARDSGTSVQSGLAAPVNGSDTSAIDCGCGS